LANITFGKVDIENAKSKIGVYKSLTKELQVNVPKTITVAIEEVVESAFRQWCRRHKGHTPALEQKAWNEFIKIFRKHL